MGSPPPKNDPPVSADASIDFDPSPPTANSICGFKFPPSFKFSFSFHLPGLPKCLLDPLSCIPFPFFSLKCDLSNPISLEWGGGRADTSDKEDSEENTWSE